MCGPKFCSMRISQDIRNMAQENEKDVNEVRKEGMKEKLKSLLTVVQISINNEVEQLKNKLSSLKESYYLFSKIVSTLSLNPHILP